MMSYRRDHCICNRRSVYFWFPVGSIAVLCILSVLKMDLALPDTKNATWKNDKTRFGYKFLEKFGWSEEKGLGKDESGSTASIGVHKREDGIGLGSEKNTDGAGSKGWGETTRGFNDILQQLNSEFGTKKSKSKKNKKEKKKNDDDDDDDTKITVGIK